MRLILKHCLLVFLGTIILAFLLAKEMHLTSCVVIF